MVPVIPPVPAAPVAAASQDDQPAYVPSPNPFMSQPAAAAAPVLAPAASQSQSSSSSNSQEDPQAATEFIPPMSQTAFVNHIWKSRPSMHQIIANPDNIIEFINHCRPPLSNYANARSNDEQTKGESIAAFLQVPSQTLYKGSRHDFKTIRKQIKSAVPPSHEPPSEARHTYDSRDTVDDILHANGHPMRAAQRQQHNEERQIGRDVEHVIEICKSGYIGRALSSVCGNGIHPCTDDIVDQLHQLHPPIDDAELPAVGRTTNIDVTGDTLKAFLSLAHVNNGKAPGISGWNVQLLLLICNDRTCANGLAAIMSDIVNGRITSPHTRALLCAGRLIPGKKSDGEGVRPISINEVLYRVAGQMVIKEVSHDITSKLFDSYRQLGVGKKGSSNRATHCIRQFLDSFNQDVDTVMLHVDFENAFNMMSRRLMAHAMYGDNSSGILNNSPISRFFYWSYHDATPLMVFDGSHYVTTITSSRGVRQGCSVGAFAFALATIGAFADAESYGGVNGVLNPLANAESKEELKRGARPHHDANDHPFAAERAHLVGLMDDVTVVGHHSQVFNILERLDYHCHMEHGLLYGMKMKPSKCSVQWRHNRGVPMAVVEACHKYKFPIKHAADGCARLGAYFGPRHYYSMTEGYKDDQAMINMRAWASKKVQSYKRVFAILKHEKMSMQIAYAIMRKCVNNMITYYLNG
jgi:hypothetical protein